MVQQSDNHVEATTVEPGPNLGANNQNEVWNRPLRNRGIVHLNCATFTTGPKRI